mmetsp:Transcript_24223/g.74986  ORF Transcript_24223/g.74986 Transcript_24223/m.74986 type:complete len:386 (-) Transcript_24223:56-1213(-)
MLRVTSLHRLPRIPSFRQRHNYKLVGPPLRVAGDNDALSHEVLTTKTNAVTGEPMRIYALSGYVSCLYLCHYPERPGPNVVALDCGTPVDATRIAHFLRHFRDNDRRPIHGLGSSPDTAVDGVGSEGDVLAKSLALAVATHAHPDHCGAARVYRRQHGVPIAAPARLERYYAGWWGAAQLMSERFLLSAFAYMLGRHRIERPMMSRTDMCLEPPQVTTAGGALVDAYPRLQDGSPLPLGFHDWTAIACHGHTGHMVGLYHSAARIFYGADLIIARGKGRFAGPLPIDLPEEYLHTVERLRKLPVRWLLCAHGGIVDLDDVAGGWDYVLDEVAEHARTGALAPALRRVSLVSCLSTEPQVYDPRTERPRGPPRVEDLEPVPAYHLK